MGHASSQRGRLDCRGHIIPPAEGSEMVVVLGSFRWRVVVETVAMEAVVMVVVMLGVVAATVVITVVVVVVGGGAGGGGDGVPRHGRPGKDSWCH